MILVTDPTIISLIGKFVVPVLLPVIVGLVTTRMTDSGVKAAVLAGLSVATGLLTGAVNAWTGGNAFDFGMSMADSLSAFTIAVATHYGLWKPTGVSHRAQDAFVRPGTSTL